jgi:hypothetical protein
MTAPPCTSSLNMLMMIFRSVNYTAETISTSNWHRGNYKYALKKVIFPTSYTLYRTSVEEHQCCQGSEISVAKHKRGRKKLCGGPGKSGAERLADIFLKKG